VLAKKVRAESLASPEMRAVLAVVARVGGQCGVARAHARAHATLAEAPLSLRDDVAWAGRCEGSADEATLTAPKPSAPVEDATALAEADPLRARSILETWLAAHPDDVAGRLALAAVLPAAARAAVLSGPDLAREPALALALVEATTGAARADAAKLLAGVARTTVEAAVDPRAIAPTLARALAVGGPEDGWLDVAEALLSTCAAARKAKACADPIALTLATARLRGSRGAKLCKAGAQLADADLATPRVRLDVVLACTGAKLLVPALAVTDAARGPFAAPESALAYAALAALQKKCPEARVHLGQSAALASTYAAEMKAVGATCPG
jgi:hypothetical protein